MLEDLKFQYMLLLRGATPATVPPGLPQSGFNTCSSCEEQQKNIFQGLEKAKFQYMLLLRGATGAGSVQHGIRGVSIHAPLARSNKVELW